MNWDNKMINLRVISSNSQMIHWGMHDLTRNFLYWITAIFAFNDLNQRRRRLWTEIEDIHNRKQGPWVLLGDFNNATRLWDKIGGKKVTQTEMQDLVSMMEKTELCEMDGTCAYFTWSNKQDANAIYSRIGRVIANTSWFQQQLETTLHIMHPWYFRQCPVMAKYKEAYT